MDGAVYAEPLVVSGAVVVATESDAVYAFDAADGRMRWRRSLGRPVGGTELPCGNIDPSGITGTPVARPDGQAIYVVTFEAGFHHFLYALSTRTGGILWRRAVDPPGFDPRVEQQRSALAFASGRIYIAYGGLYGDCGAFHGIVIGVPQTGSRSSIASYQVPAPAEAGIWAPSGPAIDNAGNLYVATGNGSSSTFDYGNSVIKLSPGLQMLGFFAPRDAGSMNQADLDLGSTGPLLLPGARAFIIGKTGIGFLLSAGRLGGVGHQLASVPVCDRAFGSSAVANGVLYVPCTNGLTAVAVTGDSLAVRWHRAAATEPPTIAGPGVWAVGGSVLYQLDPTDGRITFSAAIGTPAPFASPAAAARHIYVAAGGRVQAFG